MSMDSSADRAALLAAVAQRYYVDEVGQDRIAAEMGFSRSNISRLLAEARRAGIVEISIIHPMPTDAGLAEQLTRALDIRRAVVVASRPEPDDALVAVGSVGWNETAALLGQGDVLNVSWGRSVSALADRARRLDRRAPRIVQIGGTEDSDDAVSTRSAAFRLGARIASDVVTFPAPLLADDAEAAGVLASQSAVRQVVRLAETATATVVGIGAILDKRRRGRASRFREDALDELEAAGAVGDICGYHFSAQGDIVDCPQNARVVGLGVDRLRRLPNRLGLAAGADKAAATLGAARGRWIDQLVIDSDLAEAMLERLAR